MKIKPVISNPPVVRSYQEEFDPGSSMQPQAKLSFIDFHQDMFYFYSWKSILFFHKGERGSFDH